MNAPDPREQRMGFVSVCGAYALWGFLPIYLKLIGFADAREVLGQRILWCVPAALLAALVMNGAGKAFGEIRAAMRPKMLGVLCLSALFIFANWACYVWLVLESRVIEASLAYFLAPLVSVGIGVLVFRERITGAQTVALGLAGCGVIVQGFAMGAPPWISLFICATWSSYAFIRKLAPVSSSTGLFIESLVLTPVAIGLLFWVSRDGMITFTAGADNAILLALAGPATAAPLVLFTIGARRVSFTSLGLMQYFAPTLQFFIALAYGESFTPLRAASFAFIWLGLVLFSWDMIKRARIAKQV